MMKRRCCALVAVLACAWILWQKESITVTPRITGKPLAPIETWKMQTPFDSRDECGRITGGAGLALAASLKKDYPDAEVTTPVPQLPSWVQFIRKNDTGQIVVTYSYECWPDTVDPRPKP